MRNLLSLVGFLVVVFLGLGWYLGWYSLGISTGESGNAKISFDVNTNKIKDDGRKGLSKAGDFVDSLKKDSNDAKNDLVGPTLPSNGSNTPVSKK